MLDSISLRGFNDAGYEVFFMKWMAIIIGGLALSGCASLTPGGQNVRATFNPDLIKNCKFIRQVQATTLVNPPGREEDLVIRLRNSTAEAQGDTVFVENTHLGTTGNEGLGSAYNCGTTISGAK
jgi:hypothetical protein